MKRVKRYNQPCFEWPEFEPPARTIESETCDENKPDSATITRTAVKETPEPVVIDSPRQMLTNVDIVDKCGQPLTLDAEGHRWLASLCRTSQEHCISLVATMKDADLMGELAVIAKEWKSLAAKHEAKAFQMEGL